MKNKIIIILICFVALASCGKKSDPQYKTSIIKIKDLIIS